MEIPEFNVSQKLYESLRTAIYCGTYKGSSSIAKVLNCPSPLPEEIISYEKEYHILTKLNSGNVIKAYDFINEKNTIAIIMEDFQGKSLKTFIKSGELDLRKKLEIGIKVLTGLRDIHKENIIHKDLNPSNILINPDTMEVKIIDFGISSIIGKEDSIGTSPDKIYGTLSYISPEQTGRMNRFIDYRADFYSFGITFYELLCNKVPFVSGDPLEIIYGHMVLPPPSLTEYKIPEELSLIVMKLLSKNADERYQTVNGIISDLEYCRKVLEDHKMGEVFEPGRKDIPDRFHIPQKLYGREKEIKILIDAFENVLSGKIKVMMVSGYSGIGKSSLIKEIYKPVTEKKGYFIFGKFDQFQRNIPYSAFVSAFQVLIRQLLTESQDVLENWKEKFLSLLGENGQIIIDVIPELEIITGKQEDVVALGPVETENRFKLVFQNFIKVFCSHEHPLVIFLDDLQWVDDASLNLIKLIAMDESIKYIFLIGAYRDNEVGAGHLLKIALDNIKKEEIEISNIILKPLNIENVIDLLVGTLNREKEDLIEFGELVVKKTGGNPFFIEEFLKSLYSENLIYFNYDKNRWQFSLEKIKQRNITDNIVELLTVKLHKFSDETRKILNLASFLGNEFSLEYLSLIYEKTAEETLAGLRPALVEGLVLYNEGYKTSMRMKDCKFSHDRIQYAAFNLKDEEKRKELHYHIGKILMANNIHTTTEHRIFDIVNHLNSASELMESKKELSELMMLNVMAGKRAKMSMATNASYIYYQKALELLDKDIWDRDYDFALEIYTEAVEVAYLARDIPEMESFSNIVIEKGRNILDKVKVYEILMQSSLSQENLLDTINKGIEVLNLLGVKIKRKPAKMDVLIGFVKLWFRFSRRNIDYFYNLPVMKEKEQLVILNILSTLGVNSYFAAPEIVPVCVIKGLEILVRYGNNSIAPFMYSGYGLLLIAIMDDFENAYKFGNLALKLLERFPDKKMESKTLLIVNQLIRPWKEHLRNTLPAFLKAYESGLNRGDIEFAVITIYMYGKFSFFSGKELSILEEEVRTNGECIKNLKQKSHIDLNGIYHQTIANLKTLKEYPCRLRGEIYDENIMEPLHKKANEVVTLTQLYLCKLMLSYLFEAYEEAVENSRVAFKYMGKFSPDISWSQVNFYSSLTDLAMCSSGDKKNILKNVKIRQKKMKKWSRHAPMNFLNKYYLIEGEIGRVNNDLIAMEYYDKAIKLGRENKYLHEEALGNELAGKFFLERGNMSMGIYYIIDALHCYYKWGASGKIKYMENKYGERINIKSAGYIRSIYETGTSSTLKEELDLSSVIKASQAISGELVLENLLRKMMDIILENAGGEKGALVLRENDVFIIKLIVDRRNDIYQKDLPFDNSDCIPQSLINFVIRTMENIILNNAVEEGIFARDEYIVKNNTKSVLCISIVSQTRLSGILYLENNQSVGVFNNERLRILQTLVSQASISIENANLYDKLKASERKYRTIFEKFPIGIFQITPDGRIITANQALFDMYGYSSLEDIYDNLKDIKDHYVDMESRDDIYKEIKTKGCLKNFHYRVYRKDRSIIDTSLTATPVFDKTGKILYFEGFVEDITQKKEAEKLKIDKEAIEAVSKAKSEFLSNMSHELRTPLNAIIGYSQLFIMDDSLTEEQKREVKIIEKSGKHLLSLINEILDISKIEAGEVKVDKMAFNLRGLLQFINNMIIVSARKKDLTFKYECSDDIPVFVVSDEKKLSQILINLLNNAVKFTRQGFVKLRVRKNNDKVLFEVEDSGVGIPEDKFEDIFQPFRQLSHHLRKTEGTGLGLSITRNLVRLMGGELKLESLYLKGTRFWFEIELMEVFPEYSELIDRNIEGYKGEKRKVIVIGNKEDSIIQELLDKTGFNVWTSEDMDEARKRIENINPHIIFIEHSFHKLNYSETENLLKSLSKEIKTVLLSSERLNSEEANYDAFLMKPLIFGELIQILEKLLKLEWIYGKKYCKIEEIRTNPPMDVIKKLYKLADDGDIKSLKSEIELNNIPSYEIFYKEIKNLVDNFHIDNIIKLLDSLLEKS